MFADDVILPVTVNSSVIDASSDIINPSAVIIPLELIWLDAVISPNNTLLEVTARLDIF